MKLGSLESSRPGASHVEPPEPFGAPHRIVYNDFRVIPQYFRVLGGEALNRFKLQKNHPFETSMIPIDAEFHKESIPHHPRARSWAKKAENAKKLKNKK